MYNKPILISALLSCALITPSVWAEEAHDHASETAEAHAMHEGHDDQAGHAHALNPEEPQLDTVIITVNGRDISYGEYKEYVQLRLKKPADAVIPMAQQRLMVDELVSRALVLQDALDKKLDQEPAFKAQLESLKNTMLTELAVKDYLVKNPPTEADIKAEYDARILAAGQPVEYKAKHILLKTEEEATKLIAELKAGADFAELAKANTTDTMTAAQGGDLGWFAHGQMVPEFSGAVAAMEKGAVSDKPVKTQFGWHIIMLEDKRDVQPPKLEDVAERLGERVRQQKVQDYLVSLQKDAKIEPNPHFAPAAPAAEDKVDEAKAEEKAEK